jgi:hypothetical protein
MSATRARSAADTDSGRTRAGTARPRGSADSDPTGRGARACCGTTAAPATAAIAGGAAPAACAPAPSAGALRERDADIGDALHRGDEWNGKQCERERHDTGS